MRILVFQHLDIEHPGIFLEFLKEDGVRWDTVELDEGEPIPPLNGYDALWVMGGPMDVWEEDLHPWLRMEKQAIREAVLERRMPYLGICLGHQLLADALEKSLGPDASERLAAETLKALPRLNRDARRVYDRFMGLARKRRA